MSTLALLAAKGITKRFGGVQALSDVGFTINHGENAELIRYLEEGHTRGKVVITV